MTYESVTEKESAAAPGVKYQVAKMSFGRRLELLRLIRELARRVDFLAASEKPEDKMEAGVAQMEIDRLYVAWGLREITGLTLDGAAATPESLAERGPEALFREALAAVKAACGLSEEERKN
jgi:hypothetical protein